MTSSYQPHPPAAKLWGMAELDLRAERGAPAPRTSVYQGNKLYSYEWKPAAGEIRLGFTRQNVVNYPVVDSKAEGSLSIDFKHYNFASCRALLYIGHGIVEYMDRHEKLANHLKDKGILTFGLDYGKRSIHLCDFIIFFTSWSWS